MYKNIVLSILVSFASTAFAQGPSVDCRSVGAKDNVPLTSLHPTQLNVGLGEVLSKVQSKKMSKVDMSSATDDGDPVPVVVGPGGKLYVSDHHHFVEAMVLAKKTSAKINIVVKDNSFCGKCPPADNKCQDDFWSYMASHHFVYLCDSHDKPVPFAQVPSSFITADAKPAPLGNDPFRTLVNALRKKTPSGKPACLTRPDDDASMFFWEFRMAEKIKRQIPSVWSTALLSTYKTTWPDEFPEDLLTAACTAWHQDKSDTSCAQTVAENPSLIKGGAADLGGAKAESETQREH